MTRLPFALLLATALLFSTAAPAADPPPKAPIDEPLPKGAKARLGSLAYRAPYSMRPPAVSPDGKWIALASDVGGGWQILLADTGRVERELQATGQALDLVGFSADSRRLAAWGAREKGSAGCRVWDLASGKDVGAQDLLHHINRNLGGSVSLSADGRFVADTQAIHTAEIPRHLLAKVWEVESGKEVCSVKILANNVGYVAISPDGKQLVTWGNYTVKSVQGVNEAGEDPNQILQIWDVAKGKETARIQTTSFYARKATFSPNGKLLATGSDPMEVWDTTTGKRVHTLLARKYQGKAVAFSPDGKTLAGVGHTGWVELWEVESGRRLSSCQCAAGTPLGVAFPPGGPPFAYGRDGQAVRFWQLSDGRQITPTEGHTDRVVALAFTPDSRSLVSVGADSRVLRWDVATGRQLNRIALDGDRERKTYPGSQELHSAVLFPGGKRLATFGERQTAPTTYDLTTGNEEFTLQGGGTGPSPVAVSPDGTRVASFGTKRNKPNDEQTLLMVWDVVTGAVLLEKPVDSTSGLSVGFTADGRRVVASAQNEVTAWELATGKALGRSVFSQTKHPVRVAAGPDERSVLVDLGDRELIVWDVNTAKTLRTIADVFPSGKRQDGFVVPPGAAPTVSPDGKLLAVGTHSLLLNEYLPKDGIVRVVELASGRVKHEFRRHRSVITALAFSPDGKTLASGSADTTVLLWDLTAIPKP